jgi:UTP--glucose-1-phosphate uridylyltransferase
MQLTQAILPVAGLGTRFLPWTKAVPKELLPIGNEPIIAHIVDECIAASIADICFVISRGKEAIPAYFYEDPALEAELERRGKKEHLSQLRKYNDVDFHVVYQDEQKGDGHAILQAADWISSDHVAVCFGDDLFTGAAPGLPQLKAAYEAHIKTLDAAVVALQQVAKDQTGRYGIVEVEREDGTNPRLKKLKGLVEKPAPDKAPSNLGIVGRYLIPRSTFEILPTVKGGHGGEIRLIDALIAQLKSIEIYGYECEGTRLDTGTPEGYREAVIALG